jgi:hypothetical protein
MKKSGFYKLEDGSYEYVCGGKIVFDGETNLDKNEAKLTISESHDYHEIGSQEEYKGDVSEEGKPHTYVVFGNKESVKAMIYQLESFLEDMR